MNTFTFGQPVAPINPEQPKRNPLQVFAAALRGEPPNVINVGTQKPGQPASIGRSMIDGALDQNNKVETGLEGFGRFAQLAAGHYAEKRDKAAGQVNTRGMFF